MDKIKVHSSLLGNPAVRRKLSQKKLTRFASVKNQSISFKTTQKKTEERKPSIRIKKEKTTTGTIQIDTKIRKKNPFHGTPSLELAAPVGWLTCAAARLIRLRHLATLRTLVQRVCTSMLVAGCASSPSPAELLELPWVVSEPIADTTCVQHVVTC